MENRICLSSLVFVFGVLGLVFQGIGFVVPAWFRYDITVNTAEFVRSGNSIITVDTAAIARSENTIGNLTFRVRRGLWTISVCVEVERSEVFGESRHKCKTIPLDELLNTIRVSGSKTSKVAARYFEDNLGRLQGLVVVGAIASVTAVVLAATFVRTSGARSLGLSSAIAWTFGAILVFAAVGLQGNEFKRFNDDIDLIETVPEVSEMMQLKSSLPWAIIFSGTGALFNVVAAALMAFLAITQNPNAPGVWHTFTNEEDGCVSRDYEMNHRSDPSTMTPSPHVQAVSSPTDKASFREQIYM